MTKCFFYLEQSSRSLPLGLLYLDPPTAAAYAQAFADDLARNRESTVLAVVVMDQSGEELARARPVAT